MKSLVLFVVLLFIRCGSVKSGDILILNDKTAEVTTKAILAFFYDQRIISYILTQEEMDSQAYQLFKSALHDTHHFTFYDFKISDLTDDYSLPGSERGITPHSNTHSYIVSSEAFFGRQDMIQKLFSQNPNAKWAIAITSFMDEADILAFYRKYWDLYKMAFIFTFWNTYNFEFPDNKITNITYANSDQCLLYLFNPFELDSDGLRGKVTKLDASQMKTIEDLAVIFNFYRDLMNNLHEYTLKVVLGEDDLLMAWESDNKYKFPDGELVTTLKEKMNFNIERHLLGEAHLGEVLDNGTATGVTRMLEENLVDIIGNSRLMTDLGTNNTIYLYPYQLADSVFLLKKKHLNDKRLTVMPWQNYTYPLNYFHALIFIILVLFLAITEIFFQWKLYNTKMRMSEMIVIVIDSATLIYGFLEESSRSLKKWTKIYQRLFLCGIIMYTMLLTSVFKGTVVKDLSNALVSEDPMHVTDILNSNQGIIYFTSIHSIYRKFADDKELMINKITKRRVRCSGWGGCVRDVINKDVVMLVRDTYAYETRAQYWDNKTGTDLYHIVPEVPFSFFSSITVNKGSPYVRKLNEMILQCTEAGIVHHAQLTAKHALEMKSLRRYIVGQFTPERPHKAVDVQNIDMVLLIVAIMHLISTFIFLCEITIDKLTRKHFIN